MTFTDYQSLSELHAATEQLKIQKAISKIQHISIENETPTDLNNTFQSALKLIGNTAGKYFSQDGIGLRSILVSATPESVSGVQISIDTHNNDWNEVTIPSTLEIIRTGTEKTDGIFRIVKINTLKDLYDSNKTLFIKSYFFDEIKFLKEHPELVAKGLKPAILVYDTSKLTYLQEYQYKIKSNTDKENAVICLLLGEF